MDCCAAELDRLSAELNDLGRWMRELGRRADKEAAERRGSAVLTVLTACQTVLTACHIDKAAAAAAAAPEDGSTCSFVGRITRVKRVGGKAAWAASVCLHATGGGPGDLRSGRAVDVFLQGAEAAQIVAASRGSGQGEPPPVTLQASCVEEGVNRRGDAVLRCVEMWWRLVLASCVAPAAGGVGWLEATGPTDPRQIQLSLDARDGLSVVVRFVRFCVLTHTTAATDTPGVARAVPPVPAV